MTSKNSFLVRLIENGKRRLWLLVVSLLVFVVAIPTFTAMNLSVISARYKVAESENLYKALYNFASGMYSASNGLVFFLIAVFAILCGIQGFSYLYDRSKVDFYHSKPVKATTRFFSIWANGIVVFIVPYVIGTLLNLMFFAAYGILDAKLFICVWIYVLLALFFYLGIYHIAILALMLTGKLGVTCLGIVVFLTYEVCVRSLIILCNETFYHFYYDTSEVLWGKIFPALSPVTYLINYDYEKWNLAITVLALTIFAATVLFVALWCYKKRPTELAGSAMTFPVVKPVIKIAVAVPAALFVGIVTASIVDYDPKYGTGTPGFPLFIGILTLLIICGLIQVIYEADIKGIFHKKAEIVISFAIAMGIALFFRFDLSGYDTKIPDAEDIEYATVITENEEYWLNFYLDEENEWIDKEEYVSKYMKLTGGAAETVRNLMAESITMYMEQPNREAYFETYDEYYTVFDFCLKNGTHIIREIPLAIREDNIAAYVEQIEKTEDFIRYNEPAMSEYLLAGAMSGDWKIDADWGNDFVQEKLTSEQAIELLRAYRQDLLISNYQAKTTSLPIGVFGFDMTPITPEKESLYNYGRKIQCLIYPEFTNSIAFLVQNGFKTEDFITLGDIERISVGWDDSPDEDEEIYQEEIYYSDVFPYEEIVATTYEGKVETKSISFTEEEQLEEILKNAHSIALGYDEWYKENPYDKQYWIHVYFKTDSPYYDEYEYWADYSFLKDRVPDFVKREFPDIQKTE